MATIEGHVRLPTNLATDFEAAARALPSDWHVKVTLNRKPPRLFEVAVEGVEPKQHRAYTEGRFEAGLRFLEELRRERSNS